jgi:thiol:disulfide interchange protein DsbA
MSKIFSFLIKFVFVITLSGCGYSEDNNVEQAVLKHSIIENCLTNEKVKESLDKLFPNVLQDKKITVVYFFNFLCHHCKNLNPKFDEWKKAHSNEFNVVKAPIGYGKSWELITKAFYAAKKLNIYNDDFNIKMFNLLNPDDENPETRIDLNDFYDLFKPYGISKEQFEDAFYSKEVDDMLDYGVNLALALNSYVVPSVAIIDTDKCYVTNSANFKDKEGIITWLNEYVESIENDKSSKPKN